MSNLGKIVTLYIKVKDGNSTLIYVNNLMESVKEKKPNKQEIQSGCRIQEHIPVYFYIPTRNL